MQQLIQLLVKLIFYSPAPTMHKSMDKHKGDCPPQEAAAKSHRAAADIQGERGGEKRCVHMIICVRIFITVLQ